MTTKALVTNLAVKTFPGTEGPLDRDFNLEISEQEVLNALAELRRSKETATEVLGKIDEAEFAGPAKDRERVIGQAKSVLGGNSQQLGQLEQHLLRLLDRVREAGGSWAYLGPEFGARFGTQPIEVQRVLALASGRIGLNRVSLGLLQGQMEQQLKSQPKVIVVPGDISNEDLVAAVAAHDQKAEEALGQLRSLFQQARAAL